MDQVKIGKFIAEKRKEQNLTQRLLAEKLGITDRAVSKWETGKSMPDSSIMLELCGLLNITVNELLSGEVINMNNYDEKTEQNLLDMIRQKEAADKMMLRMEIAIGYISSITFFVLVFAASFITMPTWVRVLLIGIGAVLFLAGAGNCLKIEQTAGYYECAKCGHRYVPQYGQVFRAMHMGRTRYMKCPSCGKRSWQKKVLRKEHDPQ